MKRGTSSIDWDSIPSEAFVDSSSSYAKRSKVLENFSLMSLHDQPTLQALQQSKINNSSTYCENNEQNIDVMQEPHFLLPQKKRYSSQVDYLVDQVIRKSRLQFIRQDHSKTMEDLEIPSSVGPHPNKYSLSAIANNRVRSRDISSETNHARMSGMLTHENFILDSDVEQDDEEVMGDPE